MLEKRESDLDVGIVPSASFVLIRRNGEYIDRALVQAGAIGQSW